MNLLSNLAKTSQKPKKRLGRGYGSGKGGHTVGRGQKGTKVRYTVHPAFDGTKVKKSWIKRTPFLRGKGRLQPQSATLAVTLSQLQKWFTSKSVVSLTSLKKYLQLAPNQSFKILGNGKITKSLTIKKVPISSRAQQKIIKAGGKIIQ